MAAPLAIRGAINEDHQARTALPAQDQAAGALRALRGLHLFRGVLDDTAGRAFTALLASTAGGDIDGAAGDWATLFLALAERGWAGPALRAQIAVATARHANPYTTGPDPTPALAAAAATDLVALCQLADPGLLRGIADVLAQRGNTVLALADLGRRAPVGIAAQLAGATDWAALAPALRAAALAGGAGPLAEDLAYRWVPGADGRPGELRAVARPDLTPMATLSGYESQRALVVTNTRHFLAGLPAQDVLLYGDRGTGKSSTVKALLPMFADQGLRLVELGRRRLPDLPAVLDAVASAPQRVIVYVDDLSFEEDETEYKDAKAALQGGIAARPSNALVYATTNRRHLIRERLGERPVDTDDPRAGDAVEEKLSLADRFGLTVVYAAPDQALFLEITRHLAARRQLAISPEALTARALRWARWYNGLSGRTARQFVDAIEAEERGASRP